MKPLETQLDTGENPRSRNSVPDNLKCERLPRTPSGLVGVCLAVRARKRTNERNLKKQRGKRVYDLGLYGYVASLSAIGRAETVHHQTRRFLLRSLLLP